MRGLTALERRLLLADSGETITDPAAPAATMDLFLAGRVTVTDYGDRWLIQRTPRGELALRVCPAED